jgi:hypothetical protein
MWAAHSDTAFISLRLYISHILMVVHGSIRARCPKFGVASCKVSFLEKGGKIMSKNRLTIRKVTDGQNVITGSN